MGQTRPGRRFMLRHAGRPGRLLLANERLHQSPHESLPGSNETLGCSVRSRGGTVRRKSRTSSSESSDRTSVLASSLRAGRASRRPAGPPSCSSPGPWLGGRETSASGDAASFSLWHRELLGECVVSFLRCGLTGSERAGPGSKERARKASAQGVRRRLRGLSLTLAEHQGFTFCVTWGCPSILVTWGGKYGCVIGSVGKIPTNLGGPRNQQKIRGWLFSPK